MLGICWVGSVLGMAGLVVVDGKVPAVSAGSAAPQVQTNVAGDPNAACAGCHKEIYERYRKTPMANASGLAMEGLLPGRFEHGASGVSYQIKSEGGRAYLEFERKAANPGLGIAVAGTGSRSAEEQLKGRRELKYFLGSGKRGRTYLFEQDGYWFEIPINWYAKKKIWDMAPNYLQAKEMPLTLPVDPGCLRCHTSEAQPSMPEARNRYAGEPFLAGGITCSACHGDATAHVASGGKTGMLKINELAAVKRDSVCLSCHLEGQEAVVHQGKRLVDFRPGQSLFDYASYFVREQTATGGTDTRATSQWEALLRSGCKRGAGERLTCTNCHDPHGSTSGMSAEERVGYYRARCLSCHESGGGAGTPPNETGRPGFAATHHAETPDCTSCHMPRATANDIAHEQVTDHSIPRIAPALPAKSRKAKVVQAGVLVPVGDRMGNSPAGNGQMRNLGLAYAQAAARGDAEAAGRARQLLREAEELPEASGDHELHAQLGFLEQVAGDKAAAEREYEHALAADADDSFAAGNLALLKVGDKQYGQAVELWERAFRNDPTELQAGMNLAIVECGLGRREAALGTLERILEFSPDDGQARELAAAIRAGSHGCGIH